MNASERAALVLNKFKGRQIFTTQEVVDLFNGKRDLANSTIIRMKASAYIQSLDRGQYKVTPSGASEHSKFPINTTISEAQDKLEQTIRNNAKRRANKDVSEAFDRVYQLIDNPEFLERLKFLYDDALDIVSQRYIDEETTKAISSFAGGSDTILDDDHNQ